MHTKCQKIFHCINFRILCEELTYYYKKFAVNCDDDVIVAINDKVDVARSSDGSIYTLTMDENNHDFEETDSRLTPLFKVVGGK